MIALTATCTSCHSTITILIVDRGDEHRCPRCDQIVVVVRVNAGYVYILSNPAMPGLLKIGFTTRDLESRLTELNAATGVPAPFVVEAWCLSLTPSDHERIIHSRLGNQRHAKEFFRVELGVAVSALEQIIGRHLDFCRLPVSTRPRVEGSVPEQGLETEQVEPFSTKIVHQDIVRIVDVHLDDDYYNRRKMLIGEIVVVSDPQHRGDGWYSTHAYLRADSPGDLDGVLFSKVRLQFLAHRAN